MHEQHPPRCSEEGLPAAAALSEEHIAEIAKALGHPARIRIVEMFDKCRPRTASEIVEHCALAQSTVSEHLRILREAEVLFATHDGPYVWYCLRRSVLRAFSRAVQELADGPLVIGRRAG